MPAGGSLLIQVTAAGAQGAPEAALESGGQSNPHADEGKCEKAHI